MAAVSQSTAVAQTAAVSQLRTTAQIEWPEAANLGSGVAYPSGELLDTAVEPFEVVSGDVLKSDFDFRRVESQQDADSILEASADLSFTTGAASARAHSQLARELRYSASELTLIWTVNLHWEEPALVRPYPDLTPEAAQVLARSRKVFRANYGDYFIAGYTKEAKFTVFAHVTSEDREERDKLAAEIEGSVTSAGGKVDAAVKTEIENKVKTHRASLTIKGSMSGVPGAEGRTATQLSELPALYRRFEKATGTRSIAHLVHYHLIDARVPAEIPLDPEILIEAEEFFHRLAAAEVQTRQILEGFVRGAADTRAQEIEAGLRAIAGDAEHKLPRNLKVRPDVMRELTERLHAWSEVASRVQDYQYLWAKVRSGENVTESIGHAVVEALPVWNHPEQWKVGHEGHIDTKVEFAQDGAWYSYSLGSSPWRGKFGPDKPFALSGRRVCGYAWRSLRGGYPGTCRVSAGGLGKEMVEFAQRSDYDRGVNYAITVYGIPDSEVEGFPGAE